MPQYIVHHIPTVLWDSPESAYGNPNREYRCQSEWYNIWRSCPAKWDPAQLTISPGVFDNFTSLKERSICTYRSNPPSWKANSVDSCDPIPPYKHDMMTWTVGIDGKVWSVPPVSIDSAINKTGLRCSYVGAHKQAHIDLPILPHVLMWVNGLFCQRNPREHMQYTHTSMFKYDRIMNM